MKALEERGRLLAEALAAQNVLAYRGAIDTGALVDALVGLHEELDERAFLAAPNIREFIERYRSAVGDVKAQRLSKADFDFVRTLARGQFGIVDIVRSKHNRGVYAMKTLNKQALLSQREQAAFLEERDVLVLGRDSPWIPDLYAAFQDKESLYLVMEFVAGGDLFSMLDRCEGAVVDEDAARFYAAELVLALEDLHAIGYVHRDCKPQNTLLDAHGHVKLADFGSCARIDAGGAHEARTAVPVGTCDYIAPEALRAREHGGTVGPACDWWALGAVLYEMLYGDPPFYSDSVPETYAKIMACERHLVFPEDPVSDAAKDLMRGLLVRAEDRLAPAAIRAHPFFKGIDWRRIRSQDAPFVPRISAPDDTSNFSVGDEADDAFAMAAARASSSRLGHGREYAGEQLPFIGFTCPPLALVSRTAPTTPRGPRDDPAQVRSLRTKLDQAEARLAEQQAQWQDERQRLVDERRLLEEKVGALESQLMEPPRAATPLPARTRESAMQTDTATEVAQTETETDRALDEKIDKESDEKVELEARLSAQADHLAKLAAAVDDLATSTRAKLEESMATQKKELAGLAQLMQSPGPNASPRLSGVATLSQAHQATGRSAARLSIGSTQSTRNGRRSISAVDDPASLDSHPKSVIATLVTEMNGSDPTAPSSRRSLAPAASMNRLARAERRVSTGVAPDALSVIGSKCDRLAALAENQASDLDGIQKSQVALLAVCDALRQALEATAKTAENPATPAPTESSDGVTETLHRRKTEQLRRRAADPFGSVSRSIIHEPDTKALDMLKATTDELIASLRTQLADSETAREAAETRSAELLSWIGRESKGRALLEDMIRTAQQACKLAETKLEGMINETESLRSSAAAKDDEIGSLQATIDTREKELRHLRRASRKALDQLADLKSSQQQPPLPEESTATMNDRTRTELDAEIKEAAALHVRQQFEIARLEGEVSRLESERTQLAKDLSLRDRRLRDIETKLRLATDTSDGIRVRPMDGPVEETSHDGDDDARRFGSTGTKSHKRFKVQLQNMQKHIEYLETKLALAASENDMLKKQKQASSHGVRIPGFSRSSSNGSNPSTLQPGSAGPQGGSSSGRARPMSTMFPNFHTNMDASASTASLTPTDDTPRSADSSTGRRQRVPTEPSARPRNDSLTSSFERIRSPFKGFRRHFT
ncbi:Serine/threonine-protein kinase MRCK alpha [Coemansia sp. RSA 552]|nr:Serine/threonine-protein kinase MRCK alpha [Coemansia sp. RSA 552]